MTKFIETSEGASGAQSGGQFPWLSICLVFGLIVFLSVGALAGVALYFTFKTNTNATTTTATTKLTTTVKLTTTSTTTLKDFLEFCTDTSDCIPNKNLVCLNGYCNCTTTYYWSYVFKVCTTRQIENGTCSVDYQCLEPMTCNSGMCRCPMYQYFDVTTSECKPQGLVGDSCLTSANCRVDLGLECPTDKCQCGLKVPLWSGSKCIPYKTYTTTCASTSECDSSLYLICNSGNNCTCPSLSTTGVCDCNRVSGSEMYWTGKTCTTALAYGASCTNTYMCQTLTQGTVCNNTKCECPNYYYFETSVSTCLTKATYLQSCTQTAGCRNDQALWCISGVCNCNSTHFWSSASSSCLKIRIYTESCTANSDCNSNLALVCNNGANTCDCPTISSTGKCDCTRVYGNESFWNGTSCTATLSYGSSCASALTSYMCKTLTEKTVCNNTSGVFLCECPILKYFNTSTSNCTSQLTINQTCYSSNACRPDQSLSCQSNICKCNPATHFWSSSASSCLPYRTYANTCNATTLCNPNVNLLCNSGTVCNCPTVSFVNGCDCVRVNGSEQYWNGTSCAPTLVYNSSCSNNYTCQTITQNTLCLFSGTSYICTCDAYKYFDLTSQKCLSKVVNGVTCPQSDACRLDLGLTCQSGTCKCNAATQYWSSSLLKCVNYKVYGEACSVTNPCDSKLSLICNNGSSSCYCPSALLSGFCDCPRVVGNEMYWDGSNCVNTSLYSKPCIANKNYTCQSLTQSAYCNASGICDCWSNGAYSNSAKKCLYCDPGWGYAEQRCFAFSSTQDVFATAASQCPNTVTAVPVVAKLNSTAVFTYVDALAATLNNDYWVNATETVPKVYVSTDGTWTVNTTDYCNCCCCIGSSCLIYSRGCYRSTSCTNTKHVICEYTLFTS